MAFNPKSPTNDLLHPVKIAPTMPTDDPCIEQIPVSGRAAEGFYGNQPLDVGSPIKAAYHRMATPDIGLGYSNVAPSPGVTGSLSIHCVAPVVVGTSVNPTSGYCSNNPNLGRRASGNDSDLATNEGVDDSVYGKKVKFLCSFGGKIFPRPSDGAFRYVGGHTRILSVKRDVSFSELVQKMVDTCGHNVVIKYQLPGEDLDALVSVSCQDDLDNMMDEYEKLVKGSSDGSVKLRIFLFSATGLDSAGVMMFGDLIDSGKKYIEAVNGILEVAGSPMRKDSTTSVVESKLNSDSVGNEAVDSLGHSQGDITGPPSSEMVARRSANCTTPQDTSPRMLCVDPTSRSFANTSALPLNIPLVKSDPPSTLFALSENELEKLVPIVTQQQQMGLDVQQSGVTVTPPTTYLKGYVDTQQNTLNCANYIQIPSQMGFTKQPFGNVDPMLTQQHNIATSVPTQQFIPAIHMTIASSHHVAMKTNAIPSLVNTKIPLEHHFEVGTVEQRVDNQAYHAQVPPGVVGGGYGWHQISHPEQLAFSEAFLPYQQVITSEKNPTYEDCYMCQKALPHAHSDSLALDKKESPSCILSDVNSLDHNLSLDEKSRQMKSTVATRTFGEGIVEGPMIQPRDLGFMHNEAGKPQGGLPVYQNVEKESADDVIILHKAQNSDPHKASVLQNVIGLTGVQSPHGVTLCTLLPSYQENTVQQLAVPSQYQVKQDMLMNKFVNSDIPIISERKDNLLNFMPVGVNIDVEAVPSNENIPSSLSPPNRVGNAHDGSNSLFSSQDPWSLQLDTHFPPCIPSKIVVEMDNAGGKDQSRVTIDKWFEDGVCVPSGNSNINFDASHIYSNKAEELIKQELQSVAEDVASAVLMSSTPCNPELTGEGKSESLKSSWNIDAQNSNGEVQLADKPEDIKAKLQERANLGFPISAGIGRLQIIKNIDLEEIRELGSGTFGTVYHGKWRGTDVAIKRINDRCFVGKPSEEERMRSDFWNEAIKLADLHHPNVVAFYGVVLDGPGGSVATVTEYMVNGSLRNALMKNDRNLDKRKLLLIAMDVAFGMEYLHGKNIVHFDLKSDNLLVNLRDPQRPICKVGDLGLSKVKCQTLISGGVRGTLPWMAPELLNGNSNLVSEKVDVFSFGIVMWELLTGEEPYANLHYGAIIGGIVSNTLRPPVPESCDSEWRSLMEKCWSSESSERPSFTEIADHLRSMAAKIPQKGQNQQQYPSRQPKVKNN